MGRSHNEKNRRQVDKKNIPREFKRRLGRPTTRWADVFLNKVNQLYPQLQLFYRSRYETRKRYHARTRRPPPRTTTARERDEWHMCWGPQTREDGPSK
uniref:Reverse transcriptase n=1 Tax=Angiostrongylus cantonensis TaxID=6313 RepID=A0A0K0CXH6_ANGCA